MGVGKSCFRFLTKGVLGGVLRLTMAGLPRGAIISRYTMYREIDRKVGKLRPQGKILSISDSHNLYERTFDLARSQVVHADYPQYNMLQLPFAEGAFDHVVSDQVLEHIAGDPQAAIDEAYRVTRPGGLNIHTTCLMNPIHLCPDDFWRFTPNGLRHLCRRYSEILEVGSWGNVYYWLVCALGLNFDGVPHARWHPLHRCATINWENWPVVTWVIAKK